MYDQLDTGNMEWLKHRSREESRNKKEGKPKLMANPWGTKGFLGLLFDSKLK